MGIRRKKPAPADLTRNWERARALLSAVERNSTRAEIAAANQR